MKTVIELEESLAAAVLAKASRMKVSFEHFVVEAVRSRLGPEDSHGRAATTIELPIYDGTGGMLPGVDPTSNRSLFDAADDL